MRTIIALAAYHRWILYHMDVSTAFLNGSLDKPIYMIPPPRFFPSHMSHLVYKVSKSLYELKQSPKQWYSRIDYDLLNWGLTHTNVDSNMYFQHRNNHVIILILYVDDCILLGPITQVSPNSRNISRLCTL